MFIRVRILHRTVLYLYPSPSRHVLQKNHDQLTTFAFVPHPPLCSALYTLIYSMHISCLGCFFLPPARRPRSVTVTRASRRVSHRIASRIDSSRPVSERTSSPRPHHSSSTRNPRRTASYLFVLSTSERSNRTSHHPPCSVVQRPPPSPASRFSITGRKFLHPLLSALRIRRLSRRRFRSQTLALAAAFVAFFYSLSVIVRGAPGVPLALALVPLASASASW